MVEKRQVKLAKNADQMERWLRKLIRAANEVDRLRRERKRLLKPVKLPPEATDQPNDPVPTFDTTPPETVAKTIAEAIDDGLDIPAILDRTRKLQAMPNPRSKERKAERKAVAKEKLEAELTGKRRKLPPTGKAALDAIRAGK